MQGEGGRWSRSEEGRVERELSRNEGEGWRDMIQF